MSVEDILRFPNPEYLIDEVVPESSLVTMFSPSSHFKSFIALDMALHIASGLPWLGRDVKQGAVAYIAGEGSSGIKKRLLAWMSTHAAARVEGQFFLRAAVTLDSVGPTVDDLQREMAEVNLAPTLLVVDTLATNMQGDENSPAAMNMLVANLKRLQRGMAMTILVVHHTGWNNTERERGASSLPAAMDTRIRVERSRSSPMLVTLHCLKQKDDGQFDAIHLKLVEAQVAEDRKGRPITSLYVTSPDDADDDKLQQEGAFNGLKSPQRHLLDALISLNGYAPSKDWQEAAGIKARSSFKNQRKLLIDGGWVEKKEGGYSISEARYEALGLTRWTHRDGGPSLLLRRQEPLDLGSDYPDPRMGDWLQ